MKGDGRDRGRGDRMAREELLVPRMLGDHGHAEPVRLQDVEQWISSAGGLEVNDEVVALLVVAASDHERAGRRALARSLRLHARELLRPPDLEVG